VEQLRLYATVDGRRAEALDQAQKTVCSSSRTTMVARWKVPEFRVLL
jgi:hypothetical protein